MQTKKSILLVEDEVVIAMDEKMTIEKYGYSVHHVTTGEKAVQIILDNVLPVDLILMDIDLGSGIDGTQAAEEILREKDIPIVFLSSHTEPEVVQKTEKITSYGYVVKNSGNFVLGTSIKMAFKLFEANKKLKDDLTERKQAEIELQVEKDNLRIALNSIGDAVISTDNQGRIARMNQVAEMLCGWKEAEVYGKKLEEVFYIVNADTRERVDNPLESVTSTGTIVGLANHTLLLSKDGKEYQIADSASPIKTTEGDIIGVVLVFQDVTKQYEKDRQLKERVKQLNCLYKISEIVEKPGILLKDILQETAQVIPESWQYPEICEARITLHGDIFQTASFTLTKWCMSSDLIVGGIKSGKVTVCYREEKPPRDEGPFQKEERRLLDAVAERLGRIIEKKQLEKKMHSIEWMLSGKKDKKKSYIPEYGDLTKLNKDGLILSSLGKDQLMQISSEYLDLLETSSAIYEINGDYALGLFSSGWCQLMDAASRKLCRTDNNEEALNCGKWLCHESCWRDASVKAIDSGKPADVECTGGLRLYAVPIRANGEVIGAINFGYGNPPGDDVELQKLSDLYQISIEELRKKGQEYQIRPQFIIDYAKKRIQISAKFIGSLIERKQAETKLSESEALLSLSQEMSHIGSWKLDLTANSLVWSDEVYHIFGCKPQEFASTYKAFLDFIHPDDRDAVDEAYSRSVRDGSDSYEIEHRIVRQSTGEIRHVFERCFHVRDDAGTLTQSIGMVQDITARKQTEEKIQKQLTEKETLLREVHHRVKNNIANIESFLRLQAGSSANSEVKAALQDALSRVQSMRILYDKLLLSKNTSEVSMKDYIEDLVESLHDIFVDKDNIIIEKHISEFSISSKQAITIGIIINELLTNIFKYAFKDCDKGEVSISINKQENKATLIIQDNGIGIDERVMENKSPGFGLTIVKMLVEQLNGTYSIVNENGTRSVLQFEL